MEVSGKLGLLMATVISLAATAAAAQDSNGDQGAAPPGHGQFFQQTKARILQNLKDREACVQAANDFEDMLACKPNRGGGQNNAPGGGGDDNGSDN
jgi:hypothetical protein